MLAIVLACTDAALGQAVVSDERVPSRIRQGLNVESGLNDGLCVPLFFIAIAIAETDAGTASSHSAPSSCSSRSATGSSVGVGAGALGGLAVQLAARRRLIEPHWLQILSLASAVLAAGVASALGGSIFIAAFTGGFLFGALRRDAGGEVSYLVDEGGELFNAVTFPRLRGGHPRPAAGRADLADRALRGPQPDGRADAAGRARDAGNRCPADRPWRSWAGSDPADSPRSSSR